MYTVLTPDLSGVYGQEEKLTFLYNCIPGLEETERIIISLVLEDVPHTEIAAIVEL